MKPDSNVALHLAKAYIAACETNLSSGDVMRIFRREYPERTAESIGYKSDNSLKSAVSKLVRANGFSKSAYSRKLISDSFKRQAGKYSSKNELQRLICQDLSNHGVKEKYVRDVLQEMDQVADPLLKSDVFEQFKVMLDSGHTYRYAVNSLSVSRHNEKKLLRWFLNDYNGCALETKVARRAARQHTYLSVKDEFALGRLTDSEKRDIWTSIGFIFADGSVNNTSVAIVITEEDSYYLSQHVLPSLLDKRIPSNIGPLLITAHSVNHATSFPGSKAVARLHIEDSMFASFIQSIGMPPNKTGQGLDIGAHVRQLDDSYFFCFLSGL